MKERLIRALYDSNTITVYQAYNNTIAKAAVENQTFVSPPYKKDRMTWIKPSFLWMMYRSGWATKENQEQILAIKIKRSGFEWALENSTLSHFDIAVYPTYNDWEKSIANTPVRIQWDPEKDILLNPLPYRSIQIGISGMAVEKYLSDWVIEIEDITDYCKKINSLIIEHKIEEAKQLLPDERIYSLPISISSIINQSSPL